MRWFGARVPDELVDQWTAKGSKQVIMEGEILPMLVARMLWSSVLRDTSMVGFIDNDAAKSALIRAYSTNDDASRILQEIVEYDMKFGLLTWYERVPSVSNIADAPSRGGRPVTIPGWDRSKRDNCDRQLALVVERLRSEGGRG